jgi:hypothetical protein
MCTQLGDTILVNEVVAAVQGSYAWQRQPQAEKDPQLYADTWRVRNSTLPMIAVFAAVKDIPLKNAGMSLAYLQVNSIWRINSNSTINSRRVPGSINHVCKV